MRTALSVLKVFACFAFMLFGVMALYNARNFLNWDSWEAAMKQAIIATLSLVFSIGALIGDYLRQRPALSRFGSRAWAMLALGLLPAAVVALG